MKAHLAKVSLALLSTVFLLGCQEQGSGPVGPEGLGPEFTHKEGHTKGGGGGGSGGGADNSLDLESGMVFTGLPVFVQDSDKKLTVQNDLMHKITMNFTTATNCTAGEFSEDDFDALKAELTAKKLRSKIYMEINKSGLTAESGNTTSEGHVLIVEREGTFADESTGHTNVRLGRLQRDDVTVKWISSEASVDVFEFTGPVVVRARGVGGGGGRRSYRTISCDGDNSVTVTLDRSPA